MINKNLADALKKDGTLIEHLNESLKDDIDVVLLCIKNNFEQNNNAKSILHASEGFRNNKDLALKSLAVNGLVLEFLSPELKDDKDAVLVALQQSGESLVHASDRLKDDKDVVLTSFNLKYPGKPLLYASDRLKDDKDVVSEAVQSYAYMLEYASDRLKDDKDIVDLALKKNPNVQHFASKRVNNLIKEENTLSINSIVSSIRDKFSFKDKENSKKSVM